jgi:hypothetical protein
LVSCVAQEPVGELALRRHQTIVGTKLTKKSQRVTDVTKISRHITIISPTRSSDGMNGHGSEYLALRPAGYRRHPFLSKARHQREGGMPALDTGLPEFPVLFHLNGEP